MAVVIEGFSVVIRRDSIEAKFPGGWEGFAARIPNPMCCSDGQLARVGFMNPQDIQAYVAMLENSGLVYLADGRAIDMNVVDQLRGTNFEDDWLNFGKVKMAGTEVSIAWMGELDGRLAVPDGWQPGRMRYAQKDDGDRLRFLRRDGDVEVYEDLLTGEEVFHGRTQVEGGGEASALGAVERLFHDVFNLEEKLEGARQKKDTWQEKALLTELQSLLPEVLRWTKSDEAQVPLAFLTAGLAYRILGDRVEAESYLKRGNELAPKSLGFLRELVRVLGEQNKPEEALPYAREAVEVEALDAGAWGNLALCLIQCQRMEEGKGALREALLLDPEDKLNQMIRDHYYKGQL